MSSKEIDALFYIIKTILKRMGIGDSVLATPSYELLLNIVSSDKSTTPSTEVLRTVSGKYIEQIYKVIKEIEGE